MKMKLYFVLICLAASCTSAYSQAGVSSSSVGFSRAGLSRMTPEGRYRMPPPEYFRVEEFANYHRHALPLPEKGNRLHLSLQQMIVGDGKSVVQVGLTTPRATESNQIPPLNATLVIDQSGSMSGDRILNVKKAIHAFVERFREYDRVSIVGFNEKARVHLSACNKTSIQQIEEAVDRIVAGGSTNLHAGLMLGYELAEKSYDKERTNRVILLTDGIANVGTTDSKSIAKNSKAFNDKGISLTTIGLGNNFNQNLLRTLADHGKGLMHFVSDAKDIQKTFVNEIDSLLAPAANKVVLEVKFKKRCDVKVFGYQPKVDENRYVFHLDDLNHGATQVVLFETNGDLATVSAKISYEDAITGKNETVNIRRKGFQVSTESPFALKRNYGIALLGESLKLAAKESNQGNCRKAERVLQQGIRSATHIVSERSDEHLDRIIKVVRNYRKKILDCIERFGD